MSKAKVIEIIQEAKVGFMATVEGNEPRVRPMAVNTVWDDKLYVATFQHSRKMSQLAQNTNTEIVWMDQKMRHVRISGVVSVCKDKKTKDKFFESNSDLKHYFQSADDPEYALLEITPRKVEWMDAGVKEYASVAWRR